MHSPHSLLPEHVVALPPSSPVFGFSPRLAVDRSNGNIFVAVGSSLLVYDACHTRLLSQRRVFAHGCISFLSRYHNCLVAATGSHLCLWTDHARAAGAEPCAVLIAMDRMERAGADGQLSPHSAVQEVQQRYGLPVVTIASLDDILVLLKQNAEFAQYREAVLAYRAQYGI